MAQASEATSTELVLLLRRQTRKTNAPIWRRVAEQLRVPSSRRRTVNVGKISCVACRANVVLVPGKVLGRGFMSRKLVVGACSFTPSAKEKISKAGGKALSLPKFMSKYPDGKGVMLIGG